ncbi:MAG: cation:proton antiporter [Polyangiaceae bacterium]|nr:cation:proton antiporter [Polyangiaceae bacterium]MCB9605784.1 cation:proton antiporter [Polyangiaceae bacterium]
MRRALVLFVLLGLMLGLKALKTDPPGVSDPLTLAAIGFVVLAAFTMAEIGSALSFPRVTGYIIGGALLGPYVSNILSARVVEDMTMFNNLALGLIALSAGLELDARQIGRIWKTLAATIVVKVLLGVVLVGGTLYAAQRWLGLLQIDSGKPLVALALIMGTLSIGTSPAIALAIINENRAKGRLSDIVLGAAVLKDLVVVVSLAVAMGVAKGLLSPEAASDSKVLLHIAEELGIGAVLGLALILYIRFIRAEMLLFVAGMIVVVAEVLKQLHLDLLLVFIAAGFVVRNFSRYEHDLLEAVEMVALPVFIVFFTIAGARIDLLVTYKVFPLALALCAARAVTYIIAARLGGAIGGESDTVRSQAWLAYLPQAGVTLGLTGVAANALPEIATSVRGTGMAVVAVNLLLGPITLKRALKAAGEVGATPGATAELPATGTLAETALLPAGEARERLREALNAIGAEALAIPATHLYSQLESLGRHFRETTLAEWAEQQLARSTAKLADQDHEAQDEEALFPADRKAELLGALFAEFRNTLRDLPEMVDAALSRQHVQLKKEDPWLLKLRRVRKRVAVKLRLVTNSRRVPLQAAARVALEARLGTFVAEQLAAWSRCELGILAEIEAVSAGKQDTEGAHREIEFRIQMARQSFDSELHSALVEGVEQLADMLRKAGGPELPAAKIRVSAVDGPVKEALRVLERDPADWGRLAKLCEAEVELARRVQHLRKVYETSLQDSVIDPATVSLGGVEQVLAAVERRLTEVRRRTEEVDFGDAERQKLAVAAREAFDDDEQAELEACAARFRASASMHTVALELRAEIDKLPTELEIPRTRFDPNRPYSPSDSRGRRFALQRETRSTLLQDLLPSSDANLREVAATVVDTAARLREAREIALAVLETEEAESQHATLEQLDRALQRLEGQRKALERDITSARDGLEALAEKSFNRLLERSGMTTASVESQAGKLLLDRLQQVIAPAKRKLLEWKERALEVYREALGSQLGRDVRARYQDENFDAAAIKDYASRWRPAEHLPHEYQRLFSTAPTTEHRLFTAYRAELQEALKQESEWLEGSPGNLLLVGEHGSGRTSLLNLLELELHAPRIIRPEPLEWRRAVGIFGALAIELGVKPSMGPLGAALARERSTVLIDDLEQWFKADAEGLRQLDRFLDFVVRTRSHTNWVMSIERGALTVLQELVPIPQVVRRIIQLKPLSGKELDEAILRRHALSGREVVYPTTFATRWIARVQRTNEQEVYFGMLARASGGNIGRAVAQWAHGCEVTPSGSVKPSIDLGLSLGLPFIQRMEPTEIATLVQVMRFGPQDEAELARALTLNRSEMARHVHYLTAAGLLEPLSHPTSPLGIPQSVRPAVMQALEQLGARS